MNARKILLLALLIACLTLGATNRRSIVPAYELVKTKNGVPVYFFPSPNVPLFQVELLYDGGSDLDLPGKSGLASFSAAMAHRGVPGMDENAISRKIDDLAAGISFDANEEHVSISTYGLNEHAAEIISLMFRQVGTPTFPDAPFERMKANQIDGLKQLPDSPAALSGHAMDLILFNNSTKARPSDGLKADVERLTLEDTKNFYRHITRIDRLRVLVIGGRDRSVILDRVVAGIEALTCPACGAALTEQKVWRFPQWEVPRNTVVVVSRPGISEAHIRMGFIGPRRRIPEFYDLRVAETILSGYFASRLNLVIREKLALTYGINAGFNFGENVGSFGVSTSTRNEKAGVLLREVEKLLKGFVAGDVTELELKSAKDYLTGSFPLGLQNLYVIAASFFRGTAMGLEPEFLDAYQDRINGVTLASVRESVRKYFRLDKMVTVIAGDAKEIGPRLKAAKLKYVVRAPRIYL